MAGRNKITLDNLIKFLLQEVSCTYQDSPGLEWEWNHYIKLHNIIKQIQEKEAARDSTYDDTTIPNDIERRQAKFPAFLTWLTENGINHDKVQILPTSSSSSKEEFDGFGLKTKAAIKRAELVFEIPEKILMTTKNARESRLEILSMKDPLLRSMDNVLLAMFLLYEKYVSREGSFWKPYIDILPRTYDTILYFEPNEMELLKQSLTGFRETLKMFRNICRQYGYFHSVFRKSTDSGSRAMRNIFTYNRYIWAVSSVITRQNVIPRPNSVPDELSLVPLWDMCNHEENTEFSTDYNVEEKRLVCYASQDYEPNTEFKIFYGHRTSLDYFIHGGFVPQSHTSDVYNLELGISNKDVNFMRKKVLLEHLGIQYQTAFAIKPERLSISKPLFVFIKIFQGDKDLLDKIESEEEDLEYLSVPTEQTWSFLATRFSLLKQCAENTISKILKLIFKDKETASDDKQLSARQLMILQIFKNEKKLLDLLASCCTDNLNQLKKQTTEPQE